MSRPYAEVIGDPIAQSKSPLIHNYWLRELGRDAQAGPEGRAEYRAHHVTPEALAGYIAERKDDANWRGCNVTMPHKRAVMPHLDRLDSSASAIGAVNTIVREADGTLTGHNTDAAGFLEPLQDELAKTHYFRMARVIGTGGAARAVIAALVPHNVTLVIAARNQEKARALLDELDPAGDHHVAPLAHFAQPTDFAFDDRAGCFDLVVNASSLGMVGQPSLQFDLSHAPPGSIVYDIVTAPRDTALLQVARQAGLRTVDGLSMLIGQAAVAFTLFFGAAPPRDRGDAALRRLLENG